GARGAHHVRRVDLGIAVLAGVHLEHELRDGTVQTRDLAAHHHEAAAGHLGASGEVEPAERLADVHMIFGSKRKYPGRPPAPLLAVVLRRDAERDRLVREVRHALEEILEFLLQGGELLLRALEQRLELLALLEQRRHVLALPLGDADVLGDAVTRSLRLLDRGLQVLARRLEALKQPRVERAGAARLEALRHPFGVLAQQLDVDHFLFLSSASFWRICASKPRSVGLYHSTAGMPSGK